jgi:hypothetical protein
MSSRIRLALAAIVLVSLFLTPALASAAAPDGAPFDVKFAGVIETAPAAAGDPYVIAGLTVKTDANTKIQMATDDPVAAGMWADVTAKKMTDGTLLALKLTVMPAEMRVIGPLEAMPEGDAGTWTVAGIDFTVDENTEISDRGEPIMVDGWVEVHAVQDGETLLAVSIRSVETQEDVEIYGAIEAFSDTEWTVSGVVVAANADTKVMGKPAVGLLARVSAKLQDDGSLLAQNVKVVWNEQGGWRQPVMFRGKIEALPESGLIGIWTVDGKQVDVSEQTKIMQKKTVAEVGATVHVVGWTEGDVVKALLISVIAPAEGSKPFQIMGVIEELPESGMVGDWTVSGQTVTVTETTRIAGVQFVKVGARVTVIGTEKSDGTLTATLIHAKMGRQ